MKRLLAIGDAGCNTGFARVTKGVLDYLHGTGRYEVVVRGINYQSNHLVPYDYEVLPITPRHGEDPMGFASITQEIETVKPDVMWIVQDIWQLGIYASLKPADLPIVGYFPVDCPNVKPTHAVAAGCFAEMAVYTAFGAREAAAATRRAVQVVADEAKTGGTDEQIARYVSLRLGRGRIECRLDRLARYQNLGGWNIIPHGVDLGFFHPTDQRLARRQLGLPESALIMGSVNTNQFRKRQDLTLRLFAALAPRIPNLMLLFHSMGGDRQGWDLMQLADALGVGRRVICFHHAHPVLSEEELHLLYNALDLHINTAGGEGWGLSTQEAAACGIPQAVPDWSATRELWTGTAVLLPVANWRYEPKFLNTAHCEIDVEQGAELLRPVLEDATLRQALGRLARERVLAHRGWDQVGHAFEQLVRRALQESPPEGMTMQDVLEQQIGTIESELAGVATVTEYRQRRGPVPQPDALVASKLG